MALPTQLKWLGAFVLGVPLLLVFLIPLLIERSFSAQYLEEVLEKEINAKVEIERVRASFWRGEIGLYGLSLSSREQGEPDNQISISEIRLGVEILPLLRRRIESNGLVISQPSIRMTLDEEGDLSLGELFRKPGREKRREKEDPDDEEEEERGLSASDSVWLTQLEEARIEKGRVEFLLEKEELTIEIEEFSLTVTDLQFNPENLASLNTVGMELSGHVSLHDREDVRLVHLELAGQGDGKLFNAQSGDFDANIVAEFTLGENSYLNPQIEIARKARSSLDQVAGLGLAFDRIPKQIGFGGDHRLVGHYHSDRLTLRSPIELTAAGWGVRLERDSWINLDDSQHLIAMEMLFGGRLQKTVTGLFEILPEGIRQNTQEQLLGGKEVALRVTSSGSLKDPDFEFLNPAETVEDVLHELEDSFDKEVDKLKEEAEGVLKKLFGR